MIVEGGLRMWRLLLVVLSCSFVGAQTLELKKGTITVSRFRALLIGIDTYRDVRIPRLETSVRDCSALQKLLENEFGFTETVTLFNEEATRSNIDKALRQIDLESREDDSLLVYYAGHGELDQDFGSSFWLPADAQLNEPTTYLENITIHKYMSGMKARHVLLLSDSYYAKALFSKPSDVERDKLYQDQSSRYQYKSRWGVTSGNKKPLLDSGGEGYSSFATSLLYLLANHHGDHFSAPQVFGEIGTLMGSSAGKDVLSEHLKILSDTAGIFLFIRQHKAGSTLQTFRPLYLPHENESKARALIDEAVSWLYGSAGTLDQKRGNRLLREAALLGDPLAKMWEAYGLFKGAFGYPKDKSKAIEIAQENFPAVRRSAAWGNEVASFMAGLSYAAGLGVEESYSQAIVWYKESMSRDYALAYYYRGRKWTDSKEAMRWLQIAAEQGNAFAEFNLAERYSQGLCIGSDRENALRLYKSSAGRGLYSSQKVLAEMYKHGRWVSKDEKEEARLYRISAEKGRVDEQIKLAEMYEDGRGFPQSKSLAVKWYRLAAEQGNDHAKKKLKELEAKR